MTMNETTTAKRPNKKLLAVIFGGIAALLVIAVVCSLIIINRSKRFIACNSDEGLMLIDAFGGTRLIDDEVDADDSVRIAQSRDGKQIFFKYDGKLFKIGKNETEKELIAEDVNYFYLHESGKKGIVTSCYSSGEKLWYWDIEKGLTEIDEDINSLEISDDFKYVYYTKQQAYDSSKWDVYLYKDEKSELVVEGVQDKRFNQSFDTVYFIKDGVLYEKKIGKDEVRISKGDDVTRIWWVFKGGVYYTSGADNKERLAFYDGREETLLEGEGSIEYGGIAHEKPIMVYRVIKDGKTDYYIARGKKSERLDLPENTTYIIIAKDGKKLYYATQEKEGQSSDYYVLNLTGHKKGESELYDSGISIFTMEKDGNIYYFKESLDCHGELYFNGKLMDSHVDFHSLRYYEKTGSLYYHVVETDKFGKRTAAAKKTVNGRKPKLIAEYANIISVADNGDVFLYYAEDGVTYVCLNKKTNVILETQNGISIPKSWGDKDFIEL